MTQAPLQNPLQQEEKDTDILIEQPAKVILFNDEIHSFDEVIGQIIKATGCDTTKAEALTWEVHNSGKAMVFEGQMDNCLKVSHILEEIALNTQIEV
ncbi:MAG: ATP-dependent Clp protease adaptor ClpS [Bacteroidota bacterium]|jgi:ATP-dependent Clp protease adapter protein ClpS